MSVHASDSLDFSMRLFSLNNSSREREYSRVVLIDGCGGTSIQDNITLVSHIYFENGSTLPVQMDIDDNSGSRVINLFVPFWLVTSTFLPLEYQHDPRYASLHHKVNGRDDLCADQVCLDFSSFFIHEQGVFIDGNVMSLSCHTLFGHRPSIDPNQTRNRHQILDMKLHMCQGV